MSNTRTEAQRLADELDSRNPWDAPLDRGTVNSAAAELRRLDAVEAENKRLKDRLDFHLERSAQREQRLWVWAHEELSEPLKTRYFNIVANGTADVMEQPVYAQQFNIMRHRAEAAEAEREQLREALQKILNWNCHTTNYAVHFGSNGVRDFYRDIARQALATTEPVMANGLTEAETDATSSVMGLATAPNKGNGWLPIETAPKDGTRILVATELSKHPVISWWIGDGFLAGQDNFGPRTWTTYGSSALKWWTPLPPVPSAMAKGVKG